jgi:hypothetical protein
LDLGSLVLAAALALNDDVKALRAILDALAVAGEGGLMRRLLPSLAPSLTRGEIAVFKTIAGGKKRLIHADVPDPEAAVQAIDRALAPEVRLADFAPEAEGQAFLSIPSSGLLPRPGSGEILQSFVDMLGLPLPDLTSIPPDTLRRVEQTMMELTSGPQTPAAMVELIRLLKNLNVSLPGGPAPRPRKKQ